MCRLGKITVADKRAAEREAISDWIESGAVSLAPFNVSARKKVTAQAACLAFNKSEYGQRLRQALGHKYRMTPRSFGRYFSKATNAELCVFRVKDKVFRGYTGVKLTDIDHE